MKVLKNNSGPSTNPAFRQLESLSSPNQTTTDGVVGANRRNLSRPNEPSEMAEEWGSRGPSRYHHNHLSTTTHPGKVYSIRLCASRVETVGTAGGLPSPLASFFLSLFFFTVFLAGGFTAGPTYARSHLFHFSTSLHLPSKHTKYS